MALPRSRVLGIALAGVVCLGGAVAAYEIHATHVFFEPANLLSRFPVEDAAVLSADFALLRKAGMLNESKTALEPDYRNFVDGTGFDYKRDLDSVTASFSASGNYFIARGRFDWKKLRAWAAQQGGSCYQDLCRMQGSTPGRRISFLPLRGDTIALAVSTNDLAASRLANAGAPVTGNIPSAPVWLSLPGAALKGVTVAGGLEGILTALEHTDRVVVTVQPSGNNIEARMEASCKSPTDAGVLASQLRIATNALRDALASDKDELAAMLKSGTFDETGSRVIGHWPVQKTLLDSLTAGI
ncbi:MAG TPA: hypothetical protein VEF06_03915 [Bryobacteraceae bacterium]|nr:hypothetical protein [Bryobacteraceae bacterium]